MVDETITTSVDTLIDLLKKVDRIELEKAAEKLQIPLSVVQAWVDFLVEEKIIGMEYKFTTPFIYLNKEKKKSSTIIQEEKESLDNFKEEFQTRATEKQIPKIETEDLWKNHLLQKLERKKEFFFREARKRSFFNPETLWSAYRKRIMEM